jgi:hypothetical protein
LKFGQWITDLKNLLSTEMDFWRRAARTSRILKVRNEVITENGSNTNSFRKK